MVGEDVVCRACVDDDVVVGVYVFVFVFFGVIGFCFCGVINLF